VATEAQITTELQQEQEPAGDADATTEPQQQEPAGDADETTEPQQQQQQEPAGDADATTEPQQQQEQEPAGDEDGQKVTTKPQQQEQEPRTPPKQTALRASYGKTLLTPLLFFGDSHIAALLCVVACRYFTKAPNEEGQT